MGTQRIYENRRAFLRKLVQGTATVAIAGGTVSIVGVDGAWAMSMQSIDAHGAKTLLRMARLMYPHDQLGDFYYAKVVEDLDGEATGSSDAARLLKNGVAVLDEAYDQPWIELSEGYQLQVMEKISADPFFQKVRAATVVSLYNNPTLWPVFAYQGSSAEYGGYLDRGFDDLAWGETPDEDASPEAYRG
ncbi:gluconate 2-dehydrogenase subunit 3 family protein [Geminicoccus harenae]|uniref:gluconate 2-dehydrogenase subunit 3 family protein n=1 Tax=Geminicoccus harenae TaxID=2498453 RepID=UPI00168B6C36|nr:gluconate 2-dehydrogenase subunit 3 family protein [Geminicoccus harenae]